MKNQSLILKLSLLPALFALAAGTLLAQANAVPARVTQTVDMNHLVVLRGNVHPLARPEFDQGVAPDDLPMERMLLVLKRSDAQEAALRQLLDDQQVKASGQFHQWLTPEQFGQQFGPADSDVQAVTGWLGAQGFQVAKVSAGKTIIEFSGSAGLVRQVLGAEIHRFRVNGNDYWANTRDPQIPAALAPVVAGFASINNFPRHPSSHIVNAFSRTVQTGTIQPLFTVPASSGTYYAIAPYDFATIYNVLPLWNSGIDGTGQTIAVVSDSNINAGDIYSFRRLFSLPFNSPQVTLVGPDPGITEDEVEADLDVEWSGAVAKGATINLVVGQSTEATAGIDLSSLYIVDNNIAPVMTESYGECELQLGAGGNAFEFAIREQGAAEGITIINSSGDSGSARCDQGGEFGSFFGLAVSGFASTPFGTAVGGTDFRYTTGYTQYWNTANNSTTLASAKSYIPETTWNNSCAATGQALTCEQANGGDPPGYDLVAGGGGPSSCSLWMGVGSNPMCAGGYPKPAWQTGPGVPQDGVRDIPDISLFASNGTHNSFYVLCQQDALPLGTISCEQDASINFLGAGGTSIAAPDFAGMMAMVNQKTGERQGNANYILYAMAAQSGASCTSNASAVTNNNCIFYDVTTGNNSVACLASSKNCSNQTNGGYGILVASDGSTPAWLAVPGYDPATGLGSVNAANLVNNWGTVTFQPTTTSLSTLPSTIAHGQTVAFTVNITAGSGTPAGQVSLLAEGINPTPVNIGTFTLGSGGSFSGSTNMFPGGAYNVVAHYAGDGTHGASDSAPQAVSGQKGDSHTTVTMLSCDYSGGSCASGVTNFTYGTKLEILRMDVTDSSGSSCASSPVSIPQYPCPTGYVRPGVNAGSPADLNTPYNFIGGGYALNGQGYTEDQYIQLPGGMDNISGAYQGDNTYNPSVTASSITVTVAPAPATITLSPLSSSLPTGFPLSAIITTQSHGFAPGGTVQFLSDNTPIGQPVLVSGQSNYSTITGNFAGAGANYGSATVAAGTHSITAQYSGDSNYAQATSAPVSVAVTDFSLTANSVSLTLSNASPTASLPVTISSLGGFTGLIYVDVSAPIHGITCSVAPPSVTLSSSSSASATLTCKLTATVISQTSTPPPTTPTAPLHPIANGLWILICGLLLALLTAQPKLVGRREACIAALALLVAGVWVACGGGVGGGAGGNGGNPTGSPSVNLSATSLTFADQAAVTTSPSQVITVSNTGNGSLAFSAIVIGGPNGSDFSKSGNCANVAAGSSCLLYVGFTPSAPGPRNGTIALQDNASGSPQTITLTGKGAPGAIVNLSPTSLDFGDVAIGTAGRSQTITLSNTGTGPLSNPIITFNAEGYTQSNTCGASLASGLSCPVNITFAPDQTGAQNGQLTVSYGGYSSPQSIGVKGAGGISPGTFPALVFAEVSAGNANHHLPVTITVQ